MTTLAELGDVLTVEEAAAVLRLGRSAAYEGVRTGQIPSIKVGRCIRIPTCRLEALLREPELIHPSNNSEAPAPNRGFAKTVVHGDLYEA